jgi:2'-5' RNA ligase
MHDGEMASDPSEYWERRRQLRPSPEGRVVAADDRALALVVDVTDPGVVDAYERLRDRLGGCQCLQATRADDLHLTIKLFPGRPGEAGPSTGAVAAVVERADPFEVRFPRLNLFPDAVYAEADADGALPALNRALCERDGIVATDRDGDRFVPHLTLGYFTGSDRYERLVDFLERNREPSVPSTTVRELSLVASEATPEWRSAWRTLRTYTL